MTRRRRGQLGSKLLRLAERRPPIERTAPLPLVEEWLAEMRKDGADVYGLAIHYVIRKPNGSLHPRVWYANLGVTERIAMAQVQLAEALEEWRN